MKRYTNTGRLFAPVLVLSIAVLAFSGSVSAWTCRTHMFIAEQAGMARTAAVCFPDLTKKENDALLGPLHWHNAAPHTVVTPEYMDRFTVRPVPFMREGASSPVTVRVPDPAGVLYFKICELYEPFRNASGWEREYHSAVMAHYVGDLSQPLHNFPHGNTPAADGRVYPEEGAWAKKTHLDFDAALDPYLPLTEEDRAIVAAAAVPAIATIADLRREVAKVANASLRLANVCYKEKRSLTGKEALVQAAMSVALLKAITAGASPR